MRESRNAGAVTHSKPQFMCFPLNVRSRQH